MTETTTPPTPAATGWRSKLPNTITIARLGLTVWFIVILATAEIGTSDTEPGTLVHLWALLATVVFVIAALTDALDGYLARRWNAVSRFGRIADPLADKMLILGAFVMLAGRDLGHASGVAPWMAVVILSRELLVTTARSVFEASGIDFSAAWSGKIKMTLQSVAVPLILLAIAYDDHADDGPPSIALWAAWAATIATAASLVPYMTRIAALIRSANNTSTEEHA